MSMLDRTVVCREPRQLRIRLIDVAITSSRWVARMPMRTSKTPPAILVVAAMVAMFATGYVLAGCGARTGGIDAKAAASSTTRNVKPQTRAIPIMSVRRGTDPRTLLIKYAVGVGDCSQSLD